jgi:hypothetical protein
MVIKTLPYLLLQCSLSLDRPEANTNEPNPNQQLHLGGDLGLSCFFEGVPTPTVTWVQNGTIQVNESDSRISVASVSGSSTLQITELGRDDGGLYTCSFSNVLGNLDVNVTTVLILSEWFFAVPFSFHLSLLLPPSLTSPSLTNFSSPSSSL